MVEVKLLRDEPRNKDVLEGQLYQLDLTKTYSRSSLQQRGIPDELLDRSFPLHSFAHPEPHYLGASIVGQAVMQYQDLDQGLHKAITLSTLAEISRLGGVELQKDLISDRITYLQQNRRIPEGDNIPVPFVNFILWDALYANYEQAKDYGTGVIELRKERRPKPIAPHLRKKKDASKSEATQEVPATLSTIKFTPEEAQMILAMSPAEFVLKVRHGHSAITPLMKRFLEEGLETLAVNSITRFSEIMGIGRATAYRDLRRHSIDFGSRPKNTARRDESKTNGFHDPLETILRLHYHHPFVDDLARVAYEESLIEHKGNMKAVSNNLETGAATIYRYLRIFGRDLEELRNEVTRRVLDGIAREARKIQLGQKLDDIDLIEEENNQPDQSENDHWKLFTEEVTAQLRADEEEERLQLIARNDTVRKKCSIDDKPRKTNQPALIDYEIETGFELVQKVAYSMARRLPSSVDVRDLISEGWIGFGDAIRKYDPELNDNFPAYAEIRIRGAMYDSLRSMDWVPRSIRTKQRSIGIATRELRRDLGREPTEEEVAGKLGMGLEDYFALTLETRDRTTINMDDLVEAEKEPSTGFVRWDQRNKERTNPFALFAAQEGGNVLREAIAELDPRKQFVLTMYYFEERKLREIAEHLGLTESRVCQIHKAAVAELRELLTTEEMLD